MRSLNSAGVRSANSLSTKCRSAPRDRCRVTLTRTWAQTVELVRSPKKLGWVAVASLFIFVNWSVYVVAVATSNVLETSLGYFINPLITVLFAVVFLKEKLRKGQWAALGIGLIAVVILTFDYGRPPWIALVLAVSFATYSLAKNRVGGKIKALQSLIGFRIMWRSLHILIRFFI